MSFNRYSGASREIPEWNLNKSFGDVVVVPLIMKVNEASVLGNLPIYHDMMHILFLNVAGYEKMDRDVMKKVQSGLEAQKKRINQHKFNIKPPQTPVERLNYDKIMSELRNIHLVLMESLYLSGLIFPSEKKNPKYAALDIKG